MTTDNTVLLIHSDDTDGSTTFVDSSPKEHSVSANSGLKHNTDQFKFGDSSINPVRVSTLSGGYLSVPNSSDFDLSDGNFTIDLWLYPNDLSSNPYYLSQSDYVTGNSDCSWRMRNTSSGFAFGYTTDGINFTYAYSLISLTTSQWNHLAVVRNGSDLLLFVNGVLALTHNIGTTTIYSSSQPLCIGAAHVPSYNSGETWGTVDGYLDEIRVVKNTAIWTDNFIPPIQAYGLDYYNKLNLCIDSNLIDSSLLNFPAPIKLGESSGLSNFNAVSFFKEMTYPTDDDFTGTDGDAPDVIRWLSAISRGTVGTGEILSNKARLTVPVTVDDTIFKCTSLMQLSGDFDIQIDYTEISNTTPSSSNSFPAVLTALFADGAYSWIGTKYDSGSDRSMAVDGSLNAHVEVFDIVTDGKFRLTRSGSVIKGYYWDAQWEWDGNTAGYTFAETSTEDCAISFHTHADFDAGTTTDFDNFTINSADSIIWPEGEPNRKKLNVVYPGDPDFTADGDFTGNDGDLPDLRKWSVYSAYPDCTVFIQNNSLELSVPNSSSDQDVRAICECSLSGDFDVQIDYEEISTDAPSSSVSYPARFFLFTGTDYFSLSTRHNSDTLRGMVVNSSNTNSYSDYNQANFYSSGKFRFVRTSGIVKGYVWNGSDWSWYGSTTGYTFTGTFTDDCTFRVYVSADFDSGAVTRYDNFTVNSADNIVWPDGDPSIDRSCPVEIEYANFYAKELSLHTKLPYISSSENTKFYLEYDSNHEDNISYVGDTGDTIAQTVWDDDFKAVFHMAQKPDGVGSILDSTSNGYDGDPIGSPELVDTDYGLAIDFDGTDDYMDLGDDVGLGGQTELTIDVFFNIDALSSDCAFIRKWTSGGQDFYLGMGATDTDEIRFCVNDSTQLAQLNVESSDGTFAIDTDYVASSKWIAGDGVVLFQDGTELTTNVITSGSPVSIADTTEHAAIGARYAGGTPDKFFNGILYEIRLSKSARSDSWIKATNDSLTDSLLSISEDPKVLEFSLDSSLIDSALTDFPVTLNFSDSMGSSDLDVSEFFDLMSYPTPDDDFTGTDGDAPDVIRWNQYWDPVRSPTEAAIVEIQNNTLDFSTDDESMRTTQSNFKLSGDFDLQIDFTIDSLVSDKWSFGIGVGEDVGEIFGIGTVNAAYIARIYNDNYRSGITGDTDQTGGSSDTSGKLRISRVGSTISTYYWSGASWTQLNTYASYGTESVFVNIFIRTWWNTTLVSGSFDNFTINSADNIVWPDGEPNRKKIKVLASDMETQLPVEIEPGSDFSLSRFIAHTKIPTVSSTEDTKFYLVYHPDFEDNTDYVGDTGDTIAQTVWDDNFEAVYHMNQDPSGTAPQILDSTSNGENGTSSGSMTSGDLVKTDYGYGIDFDGVDDFLYTSLDDGNLNIISELTLETFVNLSNSGLISNNFLIDRQEYPNQIDSYALYINSESRLHLGSYGGNIQGPVITFSSDSFYHLAGTYKGSTLAGKLFQNGVEQTLYTDNYDVMLGGINRTVIGAKNSTYFLDGIMGEVRISSSVRSDDWIKATNASLTDVLFSTIKSTASYGNTDILVIDSDNINSTLTDYPLYVDMSHLSDYFWNTVSSDGGDIRCYADESLLIELPREIVSIDTSAKTGELHILVPSVSSSADTNVYIVSNEALSEPASDSTYGSEAVWKDYAAVYHMNQDPSGIAPQILDSTSNSNDGTSSGSMTSDDLVDGKIDKAIEFDGVDDHLIIESTLSSGLSSKSFITVQSWVSSDTSFDALKPLVMLQNSNNVAKVYLNVQDTGALRIGGRSDVSDTFQSVVTNEVNLFTPSTKYKIDGVLDIENDIARLYIDGESESVTGTISWSQNTFEGSIGVDYLAAAGSTLPSSWFNGILDEVRFSYIEISADQISAEYINQNSPSTFYTLEGVVSNTISGVITEAGSPVERTVRVYNRTDGTLISSTLSDASDGSYSFNVDGYDSVFVVVFDDESGTSYNAMILDKLSI